MRARPASPRPSREGRQRIRIRILTYSTKPRGGVVHALRLSEELAVRGHDVTLWTLSVGGRGLFREARVATNLVPVPAHDESIDVRVARYADALAEALAADGPADIDHAEDCLSARALLALKADGVVPRIVRTIHHIDAFTSPFLRRCQHASIADVDHRIAVSRFWADAITREYGVPCDVIPNGVDYERFARAAMLRDLPAARFGWARRTVVLAVGGVEPRKGSRELVAAFALAKDRLGERPLLVIAGGETLFDYADYRGAWRDDADRLGLRVHDGPQPPDDCDVAVIGGVDDDAMTHLYRSVRVFTFPSSREGFGIVVLEALSSGTPAVVSDLPVLREYLTPETDCVMVPLGDVDALADALVRAATDTDLRLRLSIAGPATARRFRWEQCAEAHEATYGRIHAATG